VEASRTHLGCHLSQLIHPLDRYVFVEWVKIFVSAAVGVPVLMVIMDLTGKLQTFLGRNLTPRDIALSYLFWMPECLFQALPACVLFATVFAVGNFTKHGEISAAKASVISFYRFIAPMVVGAVLVTGLDLVVAEVMPMTDIRRKDLLHEPNDLSGARGSTFVYAGGLGRVYLVHGLDAGSGTLDRIEITRKGNGSTYPTVMTSASGARYVPAQGSSTAGRWMLGPGEMYVVNDGGMSVSISFSSLEDRQMIERPADLLARPRDPRTMRFGELSRFIHALERSGGDVNLLRVERMLKIAVPMTCLIIALFGAPLATTAQRGGTGYGIGISLATAVTFLMLVQLTKAMGRGGMFPPDIVSWLPNILFGTIALVLLGRVQT
jgi:lipopolysaccharide export system permease protein